MEFPSSRRFRYLIPDGVSRNCDSLMDAAPLQAAPSDLYLTILHKWLCLVKFKSRASGRGANYSVYLRAGHSPFSNYGHV
jgi:hypothetical protein